MMDAVFMESIPGDINTTGFNRPRRSKSQNRLVMSTVTKRHTICIKTSCNTKDLMTHANTEDGLVPFLKGAPDVHGSLNTVVGITRTVGQEETVILVTDGVKVKVPREDSDGCAATDERTKDVGLCTEIEHGDLDVASGIKGVDFLGRDLGDKVLLGRIPILMFFRASKVRCDA